MKKIIALAALLGTASAADATTYLGTRTVGDATAQFSITTDDTIGVIGKSNITDWSFTLTRGVVVKTFAGPDDGMTLDIKGTALIATATDLKFDFGAALNSYVFFQDNNASDIDNFRATWLVQTSGAWTSFEAREEVINMDYNYNNFAIQARSGVVTLASVAGTAPVPEPAAWAMMIAGFGIAGAALRRRKLAVAFA